MSEQEDYLQVTGNYDFPPVTITYGTNSQPLADTQFEVDVTRTLTSSDNAMPVRWPALEDFEERIADLERQVAELTAIVDTLVTSGAELNVEEMAAKIAGVIRNRSDLNIKTGGDFTVSDSE